MNAHCQAGVARVAAPVTLILLGLALLGPAHARGLAGSRAVAKSPIYIGEIVPLTGPEAIETGRLEQAGATLAVRQINAQDGINGYPLKVILADDQSTPPGAIAAFKRLSQASKVAAILGSTFSRQAQALTPSIERAEIPMITGGTAPILTHEGDPWVFRTQPNDTYGARTATAFVVNTLHLSRIAILHGGDLAGRGADALLRADLRALGITPVADLAYTYNATDLTAQVLAIKRSGATALLNQGAVPADSLLLARPMHQVGVHLVWLGSQALASASTRRQGGALLYGTYTLTSYSPGQSPEAAAFDRASEATLHLPGDFASGYAYDALNLLAMVMRKVGTDPQVIRAGILSIRGYRGAMGTYNFDCNGDGLHQDTIVQNVQGRLRVIKVFVYSAGC